jgi:O-antigen/teichoic acid export membrane protein
MRRLLVQTSAIQSLGVVLLIATTLLVSRFGGPSTQGSFALVKSFNDLQVAIFSLGLPPAIVIMLNRTHRGHRAIKRLIGRYGIVLLLILPPINLGLLSWTKAGHDSILLQATLIGWGSAFFTIFAFLRALLLVYTDGPNFSLISIFHWIVIFIAAVLLLNRTDLIFEIAYFAAGICALLAICAMIRQYQPRALHPTVGNTIDWPMLRTQSTYVMIQTVLYGLQPFLTNAFLARVDPTLEMIGLFNIAALLISLPNLLVALIAPVLLNRWSKELNWWNYATVQRHALVAGTLGQIAAILALPLLPEAIRFIFGEAFASAAAPTRILLFGVFAVIAGRILTPAFQGLERNDLVSWSCGMRVLVIIMGTLTAYFFAGQALILALALGWCVGEYAALAFLVVAARRIQRYACDSDTEHAY